MLNLLFGNRTAAQILLYLENHDNVFANELSRQLRIPLNMVQKQLVRFERAGLLTSSIQGNKRLFRWNIQFPLKQELNALLKKSKRHSKKLFKQIIDDPADGTKLSKSERIVEADRLNRQAEVLSPYPRPKPFVKSFNRFEDYEAWKKKQTNPWLL